MNSFATMLGYLGTRIRQRLGGDGNLESLDDIFNYLKLDDRIATSGQPTEAQMQLIKNAGYTTVINLAPRDHENALGNEDEVLANLGIRYVHLPVVFTKPTRVDFDSFVAALESCEDSLIWVHCAANMRVSAFFYKYRTEQLGWSIDDAKNDMHKIWEPNKVMPVWQTFIDDR